MYVVKVENEALNVVSRQFVSKDEAKLWAEAIAKQTGLEGDSLKAMGIKVVKG